MKKEHKIIFIISLLFLVYILLFISKFAFNLSSTIELSEFHLHEFNGTIPKNVVIYNTNGFDGQFYYMMALNPSLEKIRISPHFFQRIIYPILSLILAFGAASLIPFTMILINYISLILSSYFVILLLKKYNANLNLVYLWAFNVAILVTLIRNLTAPLMALFAVLTIFFMEKRKHIVASICLALTLLTREVAFPFYIAVLLFFLVKKDLKKCMIYFLSVIPFLVWQIILILKYKTVPLFISYHSIAKPFLSFFNYSLEIFPNINALIIQPVLKMGVFNIESLRAINKFFSPMPLLLFAIIQFLIILMIFLKTKRLRKYAIFLLSQITLIFAFNKDFFARLEIDALGRYAILMYLFSILFYAKENKNYNKFLKVLSLILVILLLTNSFAYFIQKIIVFSPSYYLS